MSVAEALAAIGASEYEDSKEFCLPVLKALEQEGMSSAEVAARGCECIKNKADLFPVEVCKVVCQLLHYYVQKPTMSANSAIQIICEAIVSLSEASNEDEENEEEHRPFARTLVEYECNRDLRKINLREFSSVTHIYGLEALEAFEHAQPMPGD
jgi:hypothetical protein